MIIVLLELQYSFARKFSYIIEKQMKKNSEDFMKKHFQLTSYNSIYLFQKQKQNDDYSIFQYQILCFYIKYKSCKGSCSKNSLDCIKKGYTNISFFITILGTFLYIFFLQSEQ